MCQRSNAAATDHPTILLNHPIGGARLAVEFKQLIEVGVGYGVALISRQPVFRRNLADNVGDSSIVFSGDAAQRRRNGRDRIHTITHSKKMTDGVVNNIGSGGSASGDRGLKRPLPEQARGGRITARR